MSKNALLKRKIVFAVIILFIGTSVASTIVGDTVDNTTFFIACESVKSTSSINKDSLSTKPFRQHFSFSRIFIS